MCPLNQHRLTVSKCKQGLNSAFLFRRSVLMALTRPRPPLKSSSDKLNWQGNNDAIKLRYHPYHKMYICPQGNTRIIKGNMKLQHRTWSLWNWDDKLTRRQKQSHVNKRTPVMKLWHCAVSVVYVLSERVVTIKWCCSVNPSLFCFLWCHVTWWTETVWFYPVITTNGFFNHHLTYKSLLTLLSVGATLVLTTFLPPEDSL